MAVNSTSLPEEMQAVSTCMGRMEAAVIICSALNITMPAYGGRMFIFPARVAEQSALMAGLSLPEALIFPAPESMVLIQNRRITVKKKFKNAEMAVMLNQLRPLLSHRDKIGYVAARNFRILGECLTEYETFRNSLIEKYGEEVKGEHGQTTIGINLVSD